MRLLVTGGSGFIGRALVSGLRSRGHEVLAPSHSELDLLDAEEVRRWLDANRPEVIVHSATKPGHRNASDLSGIVDANLRMFFNLVRDESLCPRMVFLSSGAVYAADSLPTRVAETYFDTHVPADDHGFSKYVIAKYIESADNIVELRLFGVFGPGEDYAIRFISNAVCKALLGLPVTLRQDREFSYLWVEDLVGVVDNFLGTDSPADAYNVAPEEVVRLARLAEVVLEVTGKDVPVVIAVDGEGLPYSADNSLLRTTMPGVAFTPARRGIELLHDWYASRLDSVDRSKLLVDR